jgi:hypothetical protein
MSAAGDATKSATSPGAWPVHANLPLTYRPVLDIA